MALAIGFALASASCGGGGESGAQPPPPPPPPPADSQAPQAALSAPASGATVSGSLNVSATASDNVGVVGVQFKLDGVNLGTEDTSAPYDSHLGFDDGKQWCAFADGRRTGRGGKFRDVCTS